MIPVIARTLAGLAAARACLPGPVVLVPTMGALHDGHRVVLRHARELAQPDGSVVVSVFVNPLQFGPGEDLDRYPRTLEQDVAVCCEEGAAVVFAPARAQMYPAEQMITVSPGQMGRVFELGLSRRGSQLLLELRDPVLQLLHQRSDIFRLRMVAGDGFDSLQTCRASAQSRILQCALA